MMQTPEIMMSQTATFAPSETAKASRITLPILGMHCASCAGRVEKALAAAPGVSVANVNLALENTTVSFDDTSISPEVLVDLIEKAGFQSRLPEAAEPETNASREMLELAIAVALTLPLLAQMVLMMAGTGLHLPPWAEFSLAAPVQFYIGRRFYVGAWKALKARSGTMDQLVVMGTGAAFFYSVWVWLSRGDQATGSFYFEASAVVITLVLAGKALESRTKRSASAALRAMMSLHPETVRVLRGDVETEVALGDVRVADTVVLLPGERLAVDGEIIEGRSEFDEALVTGEPIPILHAPGDKVIAGSINGTGRIELVVDKIGADTTLARIADLIAQAQNGKAPIQKLVDRVAAVFVPAVLVIALVTFAAWMLVGASFETALVTAISVLVIACPCALGLATPTALVAGTGAAARAGILIKDIETLERAGHITMVAFDKTGTLTRGKPEVTHIEAFEGDDNTLLALAASVQSGSEHPLGRAIVSAGKGLKLPKAKDIQATPGAGVSGIVEGQEIRIGRQEFAAPKSDEYTGVAENLASKGKTVVWVAREGNPIGLIALDDQIRDGAKSAIAALKKRGVRSALLTGDNQQTADRIARKLGIETVRADVRPDGKVAAIKDWTKQGFTVAMIGDGINDAPALAAAELGIAMGTGTDVALETAGIALMRSNPGLVDAALDIARHTARKIRQNLFWAFGYNVVLLPVAALGFLNPMLAGLAMALSSVCVVGNALLLKRWRADV